MDELYHTLSKKAKATNGMWSKRAKEYDTKVNSGNIMLLSEVVRDLHRNAIDSERSYSERVIYENAMKRLVDELLIVIKKTPEETEEIITNYIATMDVEDVIPEAMNDNNEIDIDEMEDLDEKIA